MDPTSNTDDFLDKAQAAKYNGMLDCVAKIVRQEGFWTLYQGLESTMWRHVLWNSGYFGCIFQVRALLPANPTKDKSVQMRNDLISGSIGGTVGTILNTPMDVVKSRIQNSPKVAGGVPKYGWAWPALGLIAKEEGFGALYKGFLPKVLRLGPGGGILLVVSIGPELGQTKAVTDVVAGLHWRDGLLPKDARRRRLSPRKHSPAPSFLNLGIRRESAAAEHFWQPAWRSQSKGISHLRFYDTTHSRRGQTDLLYEMLQSRTPLSTPVRVQRK